MGARQSTSVFLCAITSSLFAIWYISALVILAGFHAFGTDSTPKDPNTQLSKKERKLVFDVGYYVRLAGFDIEDYEVETEDGHLLSVHRIVQQREKRLSPRSRPKKIRYVQISQAHEFKSQSAGPIRHPVLLVPGLMQSSAAYATSGPDAIALTLFRKGYDVWLGNNRGGFDARHEYHSYASSKLWDWTIKDMGTKDIPAIISHIQTTTGASKVALVGHSQGTAQIFMGLSKGYRPETGTSVSSFSALAPAVYAGPLTERWFLKIFRLGPKAYHTLVGYHAFFGLIGKIRDIIPLRIYSYFAYVVFNYMLGWTDTLWDRHYRDRNLIFTSTYVSAKHMQWWLGKGGFADVKCVFDESEPQWFDERFPPLALFAPGRDGLVLPERLINRLNTHEDHVDVTVFDLPSYSHLDVLWAKDVATQITEPLAKFIWSNISHEDEWLPVEL